MYIHIYVYIYTYIGDAEWAVTILKESIKAGLRVDFSIYQRVIIIYFRTYVYNICKDITVDYFFVASFHVNI
jgi:hypothetical protein